MKLFAFLGVSGSGKSTIQHQLPFGFVTNYTTRPLRKGEINGYHINHVTQDEFIELKNNNRLIENTCYAGNYYGTPIEVIDSLKRGQPYHSTLDFAGVNKLKGILGQRNVVSIYIKPPSIEAIRERMINRGDSLDQIEGRINHLLNTNEFEHENTADYVVVNHDINQATIEVMKIVIQELVNGNTIKTKFYKEN